MRRPKGLITTLEINIPSCRSRPVKKNCSNGAGFTLIELLVVIAVISLLMAILVPSLQRVRKKAKAIVCQSNLRQWGVVFEMYTNENNNRFFRLTIKGNNDDDSDDMWLPYLRPYHQNEELAFCPVATKPGSEPIPPDPHDWPGWIALLGDRSSAWYIGGLAGPWLGSYSINQWVRDSRREPYWRTCLIKTPASVPVFLDSRYPWVWSDSSDAPVEYEDAPIRGTINWFCTNRHDGFVNGLFMDWSVRKVGLKELWTLKWHRNFDTAGQWTKAGGVEPEDWPQWMRSFKDY